ncbi:MAG TPA: transglycosylase SLT domain-containing protein [Gammaproteobacteria bacterium]|nr:transglycosylase SLT domain-containing protein [Gammaproteobacteria bacterium]
MSILLVTGCAQAPTTPVTDAATSTEPGPEAASAVREDLVGAARAEFLAAMQEDPSGPAEARMEAALGQLRDAATSCIQAQKACDAGPVLDVYESLLRLQLQELLAHARDLAEPVSDEGEMIDGELGLSTIVTDLPEAGRAINLLNGEQLQDLIELNGPVKAALEDWLSWMRPNLMEAWENYQFMRHLMWPHYEEAGLPEALLFGILAKESGGKVHAVSRVGASGPLQFMPATGRRYGLGIVNGFDQRFDPDAATRANVAYLNEQFRLLNNNLELVLAAYNGGENRVRRLLQSTGKNRIWDDEIYWALPSETREYVPMVLAAAWLFMHAEDYRLEFPDLDTRAASITLKREAALSELAVCLGQSGSRAGWFRVLRNLNAAMNPSERQPAGTTVALPATLVEIYDRDCVEGPYQELAASLHSSKRPAGPQLRPYVVRRGDTLSSIARSVRCANVRQIADLNNVAPPRYLLRVGQRLQIPNC